MTALQRRLDLEPDKAPEPLKDWSLEVVLKITMPIKMYLHFLGVQNTLCAVRIKLAEINAFRYTRCAVQFRTYWLYSSVTTVHCRGLD